MKETIQRAPGDAKDRKPDDGSRWFPSDLSGEKIQGAIQEALRKLGYGDLPIPQGIAMWMRDNGLEYEFPPEEGEYHRAVLSQILNQARGGSTYARRVAPSQDFGLHAPGNQEARRVLRNPNSSPEERRGAEWRGR